MNPNHNSSLNNSGLLQLLRSDARDVKECFTRFSFQALMFSAVLIGIIVKFQKDDPRVAWVSVIVITVLLSVSRIGNYKYTTANRHYGYEIFLNNLLRSSSPLANRVKELVSIAQWEELMHAWRVIQPTIYKALYKKNSFKIDRLRREYRNNARKWFDHKSILVSGANYVAGTYVKSMHQILLYVSVAAFLPLIIFVNQVYSKSEPGLLAASVLALTIIMLLAWRQIIKIRLVRKQLEKGIHSILSCAVIWHAVAIAHYRTIRYIEMYENKKIGDLTLYTRLLSQEAFAMSKYAGNLPVWISMKEDDKRFFNRKNIDIEGDYVSGNIKGTARLKNISPAGVCLEYVKDFSSGAELELSAFLPQYGDVKIKVEVMKSDPDGLHCKIVGLFSEQYSNDIGKIENYCHA